MLISIITINFNDLEGLQKTMNSVFAQTYKDIDYVIIDGGSTDGSKEYIESYHHNLAYWVSETDKGIYHAMNKGIDGVSGEYVLFLNSGDFLVNEFVIEKFVDFNPVQDLVYGNILIQEQDMPTLKIMPEILDAKDAINNSLNHQCVFFKNVLFDKGNRYDENYKIVGDWVFINNAIIFGNATVKHINLIISSYDLNGISGDKKSRLQERKKYLESNFEKSFYDSAQKKVPDHRNLSIHRIRQIFFPLTNSLKKIHRALKKNL